MSGCLGVINIRACVGDKEGVAWYARRCGLRGKAGAGAPAPGGARERRSRRRRGPGHGGGTPFRLAYEVRCDPYWRVRAVRVGVPGEPPRGRAALRRGGGVGGARRTGPGAPRGLRVRGHLRDAVHEHPPRPEARPRAREFAEITVAYFEGVELPPWPEPQRYTCLERAAVALLFRPERTGGGFPPTYR